MWHIDGHFTWDQQHGLKIVESGGFLILTWKDHMIVSME